MLRLRNLRIPVYEGNLVSENEARARAERDREMKALAQKEKIRKEKLLAAGLRPPVKVSVPKPQSTMQPSPKQHKQPMPMPLPDPNKFIQEPSLRPSTSNIQKVSGTSKHGFSSGCEFHSCRACSPESGPKTQHKSGMVCVTDKVRSNTTKHFYQLFQKLTCRDRGVFMYECLHPGCGQQAVASTAKTFSVSITKHRYAFVNYFRLNTYPHALVSHYLKDHPEKVHEKMIISDCYQATFLQSPGIDQISGDVEFAWHAAIKPSISLRNCGGQCVNMYNLEPLSLTEEQIRIFEEINKNGILGQLEISNGNLGNFEKEKLVANFSERKEKDQSLSKETTRQRSVPKPKRSRSPSYGVNDPHLQWDKMNRIASDLTDMEGKTEEAECIVLD